MVKLFNNLNTVQSIRIKDRSGRYYTTFIESKKSTEIEGYQMTDDIRYRLNSGSLVEIKSGKLVEQNSVIIENLKLEESVSSKPISEEPSIEVENDQPALVNEDTVETSKGLHVCEICGSEFASKRGLDMHKSRSHK